MKPKLLFLLPVMFLLFLFIANAYSTDLNDYIWADVGDAQINNSVIISPVNNSDVTTQNWVETEVPSWTYCAGKEGYGNQSICSGAANINSYLISGEGLTNVTIQMTIFDDSADTSATIQAIIARSVGDSAGLGTIGILTSQGNCGGSVYCYWTDDGPAWESTNITRVDTPLNFTIEIAPNAAYTAGYINGTTVFNDTATVALGAIRIAQDALSPLNFVFDNYYIWNGSPTDRPEAASITPTIILPTSNDFNNTIPYPFNITYDPTGFSGPVTISYYINGKLNDSTLLNTTFNASDGYYILNVSLDDGTTFGDNVTVNFTIDTTIPTLLLFNLTNNTIFGFNLNATMNITMQDTNPFLLQFNWHNASLSEIYNASNNTIQSPTTISMVFNLNLTGLASGNYTLDINFSDRHTDELIGDYLVDRLDYGLRFRTTEGNDISIIQNFGKMEQNFGYEKIKDKYKIKFGTTAKREVKTFMVIADNPIYIVKDSRYKGHLIISKEIGGNWIDFNNGDKYSEVTVARINTYMVIVTVYSNDFNFQSIGGLNVVNVFYNFQVDNDPPIITSSINNTFPSTNDIVNISANATDLIGISTIIIGHNNSGAWQNVSNTTVSDNTTNTMNLDFLLTVTGSQGQTISTMACANDTFNVFVCGPVRTMQVNDTTIPTIVTGNNATRFLGNQSINFTYNVTDNFLLSWGRVEINQSGFIAIYNFTIGGTSDEFSQKFTMSGNPGDVVNVTGFVNDSFGNSVHITTSFTMTKDFFVNVTNVYDNTTIQEFTVIIANSTFTANKSTTNGLVNFTDLIGGTFTINVSSDENGGYFNKTYSNIDVNDDFSAILHQAVVYFTAVRRGTDDAILDYNISLPFIVNQSNSTGGLRLLINASNYTTSGVTNGLFDFPVNIT
ncbi:hypothetical protein LCGC14_1501550, partial [marine sediment metagenome]